MASRKLDELASDIDSASTVVQELQENTPETSTAEKLDELQGTLEDASETIDELEDAEE